MSLKDLMINAKTGADAYRFWREHETKRRRESRRKLKIKQVSLQENGKVPIKNEKPNICRQDIGKSTNRKDNPNVCQ